MLRYHDHTYIPLTTIRSTYRAAALVDDRFWKHQGLHFWIYVLCTSKEGGNLPIKGRQVKGSLPKEIAADVQTDPDVLESVHDAIDKGICWFFKVEGKGWEPGRKGGAKDVEAVQRVLEWLGRFENQQTVDGSHLLYAELNSKVTGR